MKNHLALAAKFIVADIGLAATLVTAWGVHAPWVSTLVAVATALGVYAVPNKPKVPKA